jgi:protein-S-isoprenylcysteine O-methyltransferase Ste14
MARQLIALISVTVFLFLALLLRPALLRWRTGKWGFNGLSGPVGSAGWWGGVSFITALALIPVALATESSFTALAMPGAILMAIGLVLTLLAQSGMGASWRIGVDETERTKLITTGLYAWVRNPIFTGMGLFGAGLVLVWMNWASVTSLALLVLGLELQVRFVEEPYLARVHGHAFTSWASRVGRFVPWVG